MNLKEENHMLDTLEKTATRKNTYLLQETERGDNPIPDILENTY